jgi:uncharacterized protein YjbI with pentapeptide repeats
MCQNVAVANPEHVRLVAQGWEATWDRSRQTRSTTEPLDLSGANLAGIDLVWANLNDINLTNATLDRANFSRALMTNARLDGASLQGTRIGEAILNDARFVGARIKANLGGSELYRAIFTNADLVDIPEPPARPGKLDRVLRKRVWG